MLDIFSYICFVAISLFLNSKLTQNSKEGWFFVTLLRRRRWDSRQWRTIWLTRYIWQEECSTILYAIDRLPNSLVVIHSERSDWKFATSLTHGVEKRTVIRNTADLGIIYSLETLEIFGNISLCILSRENLKSVSVTINLRISKNIFKFYTKFSLDLSKIK